MRFVKINPVHHHMGAEEELWLNPKHIVAVIPSSPNGEDVSRTLIVTSNKNLSYRVLEEASDVVVRINDALRSHDGEF